ncbi:hypothetical protein B0H16DRAFT_726286 [Mycena metata]|uniref:Uncharacterized protein n=1 Tax=Mycena metata TaxID=1033252 RepID=A0AAD7K7H4_9AGAR|nr:hypothetical protein B0H16DRAFT_726286 [Mycena metata]
MLTPLTAYLLFALLLPFVAAIPSGLSVRQASVIPQHATHLAYDEDTHEVIAFSSNRTNLGRFVLDQGLGRRTTGSCVDMSADDVKKIPGWGTLESTAQQNWGSGSYNLVTNDQNFPDQPAQVCADTSIVPIAVDGDPSASGSCTTQNSTSEGELVGANGTITLQHSSGSTYTTTTTVTKQSAFQLGEEVGVEIGFPDIADVSAKFSISTTITNTLSTATTSTTDLTSAGSVTLSSVAGHSCYLQFTSQTCTITGSGQIRMLGTGWVWFEYNDATDGHYKWALNMDAVLPNQDDKSSFITFKTATATASTSEYHGVCIPSD